MESVEFNVGRTPRSLKVEGVFVEMGMKPNVELAESLGLDMTSGGFVKINRLNQETSMPGVFAAGDLVDHTYRQAITAAGSGCAAALDAERWLAEHEEAAEPAPDQALISQDDPVEGTVGAR